MRKYIYLFISYVILDLLLKITTLDVAGNVNGYSFILFTISYALLFTSMILFIKNIKLKQLFYGISYYLFMIICIVQYIAQYVLHKFLFINDMTLANEGLDYTSYVMGLLNPVMIMGVLLLIVIGIIGILWIKKDVITNKKYALISSVVSIVAILMIPYTMGQLPDEQKKQFFTNDAYLYKSFDDSNKAMHISGLYQYTIRDLLLTLQNYFGIQNIDYEKYDQAITTFFNERKEHENNEYTNIFKGKNLIVVMMESIDDFVITKEDTPTLYKLCQEGINFTNFYTPDYSIGYTFNTEFAFNTATYPYRSGNMAFEVANHSFSQSIASKLASMNYRCRSYHFNDAQFYNRGKIHQIFGYEKYVSYQDFENDLGILPAVDKYLTQCEPLFEDFIDGEPFYSFNISYTAHLPYDDEDNGFKQYILNRFPQYKVEGKTPPVNLLRAQAKFTDEMFQDLLTKLEAKGILEDTVIVGFSDHYAYGLSESDLNQFLKAEDLYERTPAFIYCKGYEGKQVDKVMQTIDLVPTLLNMFGIESNQVMGQDIFDPNYEGYVIFPDLSWICKDTYYKNNQKMWGNELSEAEIERLNTLFTRQQIINDYILESNYYARK